MNTDIDIVFELLLGTSFLGAFDVIYFHLYKFRLFDRAESVGEEITHLLRAVLFLIIGAVLTFSDGSPLARWIILGAFFLDLVNNAIDVLLEKRSRASVGGLPSAEYLIHILATFTLGIIATSFFWLSNQSGFAPIELTPHRLVRAVGSLLIGALLLLFESTLFFRAIRRRALVAA